MIRYYRGGQHETYSTIHVGLDSHKDSNVATYSLGLGEVQVLGNVGVRQCDLDRLCKRMRSKGSRVRFVYETGPCGYGLYRYLTKKGFACMVCAPLLIARKPSDRVKTDRRDMEIHLIPLATRRAHDATRNRNTINNKSFGKRLKAKGVEMMLGLLTGSLS